MTIALRVLDLIDDEKSYAKSEDHGFPPDSHTIYRH